MLYTIQQRILPVMGSVEIAKHMQSFDMETAYPNVLSDLVKDMKRLDRQQLDNIAHIVKGLVK